MKMSNKILKVGMLASTLFSCIPSVGAMKISSDGEGKKNSLDFTTLTNDERKRIDEIKQIIKKNLKMFDQKNIKIDDDNIDSFIEMILEEERKNGRLESAEAKIQFIIKTSSNDLESLEDIDLRCSNLKELPELPEVLRKLNCSYCPNLQKLPTLPSGLQELWCCDCPTLQELPTLPAGLQELGCRDCPNLQKLPTLPVGLQRLVCGGYPNFKKLPELPERLEWLNCSYCPNLQELPELPERLKWLDCSHCPNLTKLPTLPAGLEVFDCRHCPNLQKLPTLPAGRLKVFCCFDCPKLKKATLAQSLKGSKIEKKLLKNCPDIKITYV
jgi:hypothetical protein